MFVFIIWIGLCFVTGAIANNKGRSAVGFFVECGRTTAQTYWIER
jgi:hypothetical protein